MSNKKAVLLWVIAFLIMAVVVVFQKTTGPTYPQKGTKAIYGQEFKYRLPRSSDGEYTVFVKVEDASNHFGGYAQYKRLKSYDDWQKVNLVRNGNELSFEIPHQPAAGKVAYQVFLTKDNQPPLVLNEKPVVVRFRDVVPGWVIVFHLLFIFSSVTLSFRTAFEAMYKGKHVKILTLLTVITLILGGFVFGPLMQKYAFGAFWTGWPFGHDLTDNKTAVGLLFWFIALWASYKKPLTKAWHITAAIILMAIYLIPHSLLGSELDYTKTEQPKTENVVK